MNVPPRVAMITFLKDEFSDIAGWIAWHAALGVTTFFVYDDHSTDGTWDILQAAQKRFDIRLQRTNPTEQPDFYFRQRDSFMEAAELCRGHFDWVGFLDSDEYVYLKYYDNLPEFLGKFDHADGIAFSWRIHGSSRRVIRPKETAIEAFEQHSTPELGDNVLVKSFVRPEKMGKEYLNPHVFDIPSGRYFRPSGQRAVDRQPTQTIEWSDGFVMHYICRSVEHYVQRIKRRLAGGMADSTVYLDHFDRNDLSDKEPRRLLPQTKRLLAPIYENMLSLAVQRFRDTIFFAGDDTGASGVTVKMDSSAFAREHLETFFGTYLYYDPKQMKLVHTSRKTAQSRDLFEVEALRFLDSPDLVTFHVREHKVDTLFVDHDTRLLSRPIYRIHLEKDGFISLSNPINNRFIAFNPPDSQNGIGQIQVNRQKSDLWEYLKVSKQTTSVNNSAPFEIQHCQNSGATALHILKWTKSLHGLPNNDEFLRVLYTAAPEARDQLTRCVPGLLWNVC